MRRAQAALAGQVAPRSPTGEAGLPTRCHPRRMHGHRGLPQQLGVQLSGTQGRDAQARSACSPGPRHTIHLQPGARVAAQVQHLAPRGYELVLLLYLKQLEGRPCHVALGLHGWRAGRGGRGPTCFACFLVRQRTTCERLMPWKRCSEPRRRESCWMPHPDAGQPCQRACVCVRQTRATPSPA